MKHKKVLMWSLFGLVAVLVGVTLIEPLTKKLVWLETFAPMIVITGFCVFLVSTSLIIYVIISNLQK